MSAYEFCVLQLRPNTIDTLNQNGIFVSFEAGIKECTESTNITQHLRGECGSNGLLDQADKPISFIDLDARFGVSLRQVTVSLSTLT